MKVIKIALISALCLAAFASACGRKSRPVNVAVADQGQGNDGKPVAPPAPAPVPTEAPAVPGPVATEPPAVTPPAETPPAETPVVVAPPVVTPPVVPPVIEKPVAPPALPAPTGTFRNTYYYLIYESDYDAAAPKTQPIKDTSGKTIAMVSEKFRKDLLMEGSGKLADGRVLNYAGKISGEYRFHETKHAYGRGAGNCALVPYHTIAVDERQIPLGSLVYIDETVGMTLPDGTKHDGYWRAEDTGGAILHDRIDIFIGNKKHANYLSKGGITHMEALTVRIIKLPDATTCALDRPE